MVRERVVTALAVAARAPAPRARPQDWAREGFHLRVARLCAAVLTIEHFGAGEHAAPVVVRFWRAQGGGRRD